MPPNGRRDLLSDTILHAIAIISVGYLIITVPNILLGLLDPNPIKSIFITLTLGALLYFPAVFVVSIYFFLYETFDSFLEKNYIIVAVVITIGAILTTIVFLKTLYPELFWGFTPAK